MTAAALAPYIEYIENGATTAFAVPFRFVAPTHIAAKRIAADGTVTVLAYGTDYSVTGGTTDAGGTLTVTTPAVAGTRLQIRRQTPRAQQLDYTTTDNFPAESHELGLDKAMLVDQEQDVKIDDTAARALMVPDGETVPVVPVRAIRQGKFLSFDASGNPAASNGTGADLGLREDLAASGGAALIGSADGRNLQDLFAAISTSELVMWYGNSIVEAPYSAPNVPAPKLLETALGGIMPTIVRNEGISGETAWQIMTRLVGDMAGGAKPRVVIIGPAGVNSFRKFADDPATLDLAAVKTQYQAMFASAKASGAYVIALTDAPWKGYVDPTPAYSWDATKQSKTDALNSWLLALQPNCDAVFDLYTPLEGAADTINVAYDNGDKLHINQAGRVIMAGLVQSSVIAQLGSRQSSLDVIGKTAAIDQDLTTKAWPLFDGGVDVGRNTPGYEVFGPALRVHTGKDGQRAICVNTTLSPTAGRGVYIDGTMPIYFQSLGSASYRLQGAIGIDDYGTGTGVPYIAASNGTALVKVAWATGDGNFGVGLKNPARRLTISNNGQEGLEIGPGNVNGDASGAVTSLYYNRQTAALIINIQHASKHTFKDGAGLICLDIASGKIYVRVVEYANDAAAGAAGLTNGQLWKDASGFLRVKA